MAGLTKAHTNYVSWGTGRDRFITGDTLYQGGKEAWRNSGTTGVVVNPTEQREERRSRKRTQSSFGLQVSARGDVVGWLLPTQGTGRMPGRPGDVQPGRPGEVHGSPVQGSPSPHLSSTLRAVGSADRWRSAGVPRLPPAKTLDTHSHFERWLGMSSSRPHALDDGIPTRRKSPPLAASRRHAAVSLGAPHGLNPGLSRSASVPHMPSRSQRG
mmetsp:Transcript_25254/g.34168  ORF Transcript_25254/g.34168 Transcript_25254/m.34168 type:complete len:213 (+) Transcript_25254:87-725(+)